MASKAERLGWVSVLLGLVLWALCAAILPAQMTGVSATADGVIEEMAAAAGVIFAGQVTAVRRPIGFAGSGEDAAEGFVEVEFRVDLAVRGPTMGSVYTLREWAGLWNASGGRFRVGQRLLVFLYAPDANGLGSPVRGLDGVLPLRGGGVAPGPNDITSAAAQWMVDLRWVQAQAVRSRVMLPEPEPVRSRPIPPRPISNMAADGEVWRVAMDAKPSVVRRVTVPAAQAVAVPVESEPLAQVVALCQAMGQNPTGKKAMGRTDAAR